MQTTKLRNLRCNGRKLGKSSISGLCLATLHPYGRIMRIALFQPEIPGNVGAILRLGACFGVPIDIIEPCGFVFSDKRMQRSGMDYIDHVTMTRHADWDDFAATSRGRLVLFSSAAETLLPDFSFQPGDTLLFGSESAGVPASVRDHCDAGVRIPIARSVRSLNLGMACAIAVAEALRQTGEFPHDDS
jgi:tRNA (cytidine/uridine-2'-O-)-methyltransferase